MADEKTTNVKTSQQKQTQYRALQYTFFGAEFVSAFAPFIGLGIANFDEWFVNESGWKIGLGGTLAMALLGIILFMLGKKKEDESKITNGFVTLIAGWFLVALIFWLFEMILTQIVMIMMIGGIGLLGSFGFDMASKEMKKKADLYKEVRAEVYKDDLKAKVLAEVKAEAKKKEKDGIVARF